MKTTFRFFVAFLLLCFIAAGANGQQSCCNSASAHQAFASLGEQAAFGSVHDNPLPYTYQGEEGRMIAFKAMDGTDARGFEIKAKKPSNKYLFVLHEFWGLNDYIKRESVRLAKDLGDVNVLAIDLYDGKVGTTREEATKLMQAVDSKRAVAILEGASQYAGADSRIATIGWCFGGTWSLQAALHADEKAAGCVIFYGQPETDIERLSDLDCSVLGIFASKDKWINPQVVQQFEQNVKQAGKTLTVKMYDADHAFANPSSADYQQKMAQDAYQVALAYLRKSLGSEK